MPFSYAEAILVDEDWSILAREDMQGDVHVFLPEFCQFLSAWLWSSAQPYHCNFTVISEPISCRKYNREWVKLSFITNHVATWKAIIIKTKPELLHWYWNTWNLSAKGQHSLFHVLVGLLKNMGDEICCPELVCIHWIRQGSLQEFCLQKVFGPCVTWNFSSRLWINCFNSLLLGNWAALY